MTNSTRRNFMALAGVSTAAGVAVAVAPGAQAAAPATAPDAATLPAEASGAMAAYVHDVHAGETVLMVDGHEVTVTDKALVAHLARAYAKAARAAARG